MDGAIVARIEGWEEQPFSGGYAGLRELADREFTGAVTTGSTWLFMLNGRAVGVTDGTMGSFEGADGTAYRAPHPSVALLFAMQAEGGQTQAKYFTDDTPLKEAHRTLSEGNFVGYIELSENVLSGDYYVAYYGGRALSAAFVGNEERLLTGDEAFERASDEVGIYEVRAVDLEVRDIPEPQPAGDTGSPVDAGGSEPDTATGSQSPAETDAREDSEPVESSGATPTGPEPGTEPEVDGTEAAVEDPTPADTDGGTATAQTVETDRTTDPTPDSDPTSGAEGTDTGATTVEATEDRIEEEAAWQETHTVPAIDPEDSVPEDREEQPDANAGPTPSPDADPSTQQPAENGPQSPSTELRSRIAELEEALEEKDATIEDLRDRLEAITAERDELRAERDELQTRIEELQTRLEAEQDGHTETPSRRLSPEEALTQTDLFVRYDSKGKATLEKARDGAADRDAVASNLRLEEHTRFDAATVSVDGDPYDAFLKETITYRFVRWLIEDLLYEIRDTGNEKSLKKLYDALPRIDRAEFNGTITIEEPDGEREETFDVVCRDRMGRPLIVADFNPERDPATGEMMGELIEGATAVAERTETLSAAFLVTASFFEPDALETADEATGSGFLSRDNRQSLVKLSRKDGYHLCLAEARDEAFHVAVPEL